jgi:hypothetical protein
VYEAGMSYRDIAASAYRAYAASTGNKNYQGNPMPAFDDLPQPIQTAWEAAIRQAENCFLNKHPGDEQTWQGWVPPHLNNACVI